jgi:hypothetical protein
MATALIREALGALPPASDEEIRSFLAAEIGFPRGRCMVQLHRRTHMGLVR